ncbi:hypothetical protein SPAN111604_13095 [Sphingomonas antarctica]
MTDEAMESDEMRQPLSACDSVRLRSPALKAR